MSIFGDYVEAEAEKKGKSKAEWLMEVAQNAGKCQFSTHIGRFSNPDVTVNWQAQINNKPMDPYVSTASVACSTDIFVAANYLATAGLLQLKLEDGATFYEHIKAGDELLKRDIKDLHLDYETLREAILAAKFYEPADSSDERLKQVYFPVGDDEYHLLTVLPPSSIIQEVYKRIRAMEECAKQTNDKKSETYGGIHFRIYNLVSQKFGGSNPQNVSFVNSRRTGRSYMLPSLPPILEKREIIYPRKNFFRETLRLKYFTGLFQYLHARYSDRRNNKDIRLSVRKVERQIMDLVLQRVYALRQLEQGWSDKRELSREQSIWLDDKYKDLRCGDKEWQEKIAEDFTKWMMNSYRIIMGKEKLVLGDGEFDALYEEILEDLKQQEG